MKRINVGNKHYVYLHHKQTTKEIFYVGKGKDDRAYSKNQRNKFWNNVVAKHGFFVSFIATNLSDKEALDLEVETITRLRSGGIKLVNMTNGGEGLSGFVPSAETRLKCSINNAMKKQENRDKVSAGLKKSLSTKEAKEKRSKISKEVQSRPEVKAAAMLRRHTEETKKKMSQNSAMKRPEVIAKFIGDLNPAKRPEVRAKISASKKGFRHTEESKKKMSERRKNIKLSEEHKKKIALAGIGRKHSQESMAKMSASRLLTPKIQCPKCGIFIAPNVAKRWHFDNCRKVNSC